MPRSRLTWGRPCTWEDMTRVTLSNGVRFTVNRGIAELVGRLGEATLLGGYEIRHGVSGGYNCRRISGTSSYSNHAWGLAVDINWDTNPWRSTLVTDMPEWMPELWRRYGFRWGGWYRRPDAMHYEFMGTRGDALRTTTQARNNQLGEDLPAMSAFYFRHLDHQAVWLCGSCPPINVPDSSAMDDGLPFIQSRHEGITLDIEHYSGRPRDRWDIE